MRIPLSIAILLTAAAVHPVHADPEMSIASDTASTPDEMPRLTGTVGFGSGYLGGTDASQGAAFRIGLGYHLTPRLQVSFDGNFVSFARYRPDPRLARQLGVMTLGLRYRPFGERRTDDTLDLANLQLRTGIGAAHELRIPYADANPFSVQQGPWGLAIDASVAWLPLHGSRWDAGVELQASYARFADNPHRSTAAMLVLNFDFGSKRKSTKAPNRVARN
jgi:hypothetical protein